MQRLFEVERPINEQVQAGEIDEGRPSKGVGGFKVTFSGVVETGVTADALIAISKRASSRARASRFGVRLARVPRLPTKSARVVSSVTSVTLRGCSSFVSEEQAPSTSARVA
ncbi:MAG: hypothetical protein QF848_16170, partial [Planctomycetota bacterium]|nr:hypothetical protein [Planctomycetota bacterium]